MFFNIIYVKKGRNLVLCVSTSVKQRGILACFNARVRWEKGGNLILPVSTYVKESTNLVLCVSTSVKEGVNLVYFKPGFVRG